MWFPDKQTFVSMDVVCIEQSTEYDLISYIRVQVGDGGCGVDVCVCVCVVVGCVCGGRGVAA